MISRQQLATLVERFGVGSQLTGGVLLVDDEPLNLRVLKDLLPVMDNLDRALAAAAPDDPLVAGVKLVRSTFEQALSRHGVKSFSALGQPFDPARHGGRVGGRTAGAGGRRRAPARRRRRAGRAAPACW